MPLTPDQELGCESRGGSRLVSAAAGSGKTRVLVERLMRYVDRGADIDSFLVVTYTRAAAGELRARILAALRERIARDPSDRRLRRQTELCCRAPIGTIDSICARFLRENAHLCGIAPDFQVIEPDRAETLRALVLDRKMDALYEHLDQDAAMAALVDSFGSGRDDRRLTELVLRLHAAVQSHPDPAAWMEEQRRSLCPPEGTDAGDTPWGAYLLARAAAQTDYLARRMEDLLRRLYESEEEKLRTAYAPSVEETARALRTLSRAAGQSWEQARAAVPVPFPRLGGYRGDDPLADTVKEARQAAKDALKPLEAALADDSPALIAELRAAAPAMDALLRLTGELEGAYQAEKKRQGLLDFSDLEHCMLALLEREPSLRESLSGRYTEVLVDEYQDVNACQDRLFTLLSDGGRKLFTVGDVKQSIYRFRLADPGIFLRKYDAFPPAAGDMAPGQPGRILLRENFRSRREVIDAVNHVFKNIMSRSLGELDYDADAALRPGRELPPGGGAPAELTVLSLPEGDGAQSPDKIALEAEYVARKIRELVDAGTLVTEGEGLRRANYGDFAILLRSHKSATGRFRAALSAQGIPSISQQGGGFFRSLEVTVLLSVLAVIDNPRQDVALIAALRSPLFGFTADDLSAIRATDKNVDFYTALTLAAEKEDRFAAFLRRLEDWRAVSADLAIEALLSRLVDETDLFALLSAMPDGAARRENVQLLMDYARDFELSGYRGIFRFIEWMRTLEERGQEPRTGAVERREAVQIISIHHSKGLEYPVVFLAGTGRKFNKQDSRFPVLIHPLLGIGGKVVDTARGIQYPSLAWRAIARKLDEETLSEEMRVLYVAMTRAKDRLYISCMVPGGEKTVEKLSQGLSSPLEPELLRGDLMPAYWLIRAALLPDSPLHLHLQSAGAAPADAPPEPDSSEGEAAPEAEAEDLSAALDWRYPREWAVSLPSKITASALEGREEPDADSADLAPEHRGHKAPRRPVFGSPAKALTGAELGTAAHALLQYIDFAKTDSREAISAETERLRSQGRLSDEQAAAVDPAMILSFFRSPIGQRVLRADRVWRELRFSLLTGAEEFFPVPAGEQLLLQGVADCCIREGDALTVIDFKTDRVTAQTMEEKIVLYTPQLRAYAAALERILGLPVKEAVLFFLRGGLSAAVELSPVKKSE
ncbi:MAG: UvrD-helicase domain-containing protein [Oscillospiraceae bacterium]|nr:UvrD-helicase domain-containing protein [Oscillospiraceae bacterium]